MTGQEETASCCPGGGLDWLLGKISSGKGCQTLEQAAQRSGGVTMPIKRCVDVAHLRTLFSGELGHARLEFII